MKALVIPSNREGQLKEFLAAWHDAGDWDCVVLVEDSDQLAFDLRPDDYRWPLYRFSHAEIADRLGPDAWIISRGDSARRCFGFLAAVELGAEWILTLDDDTRPAAGVAQICAAHLAAMRDHAVCRPTAGKRTRGLPYRQLGEIRPKLNMGLWAGNEDVDGPTGLLPQVRFEPPAGSTLANPRCRYPLCGMNVLFHRDVLPAMYFPLMGQGQPYRRFDDIWCGWLMQKIFEHCGINWSFGDPAVEHIRASDPFKNLVAEAPGIVANETAWQRINAVELSAGCALSEAVVELGNGLEAGDDAYWCAVGEALKVWGRLAVSAMGGSSRAAA